MPAFLDRAGVAGRRAHLDVRAADPLPDGAAIVADLRREMMALGVDVVPERERADMMIVGPGDPFHLLRLLRAVPPAGIGTLPYIGVSAGAAVAAPTLAPLALTSPFTPPADLDLHGLNLCEVLVLCHRHRPGRAALHRSARARFGTTIRMIELADREAVEVHGGVAARVASPRVARSSSGATPRGRRRDA